MHSVAGAILALSFCVALGIPTKGREEVTFNQDVAKIIYSKCTPCHSPGGPGPFSLITYADVKRRYSLIRQVALTHAMPPTDAQSDLGKLAKQTQLNDEEGLILQQWGKDGLKEGDPETKPPDPVFTDTWKPGEADLLAAPSESITVPADGPAFRRLVTIDLDLDSSNRLASFDLRPSKPGVIRFVRIGLPTEDGKSPFKLTGVDASRLIGTWAPGYFSWALPKGSAVTLEPKVKLFAEVLYQPTGKPEDGSFELALTFAGGETKAPMWYSLGKQDFEIPKSSFTELESDWTLPNDVEVISLHPEAKLYARQIRVMAYQPGEPPKTLLLVFSYDPNWMGSYVFEKPVKLKKGTRLVGSMQYDNVEHANDRTRGKAPIRSGPGERDELFWIHVQYVQTGGS